MRKSLILIIIFCISTGSLYSQNKTIKGRVISEQFDTLPLTSIVINDTVDVGRTDLKGFFQIEIPVHVRKLLFRNIGLDLTAIELVNKCDEVEVVMMLRCTCDFMTPKQVDRFEMRRFKKLAELHKEAFGKGLFKTDKACYTQEFIHHYKKHKK